MTHNLRAGETKPFGSLASQISLPSKFQDKENPCPKRKKGGHDRNNISSSMAEERFAAFTSSTGKSKSPRWREIF